MKKLNLALLMWVFTLTAFAQQKQIDSLNHLLKKTAKNDTARISYLLDVSYFHALTDPNAGMKFLDEGIQLAKTLNTPKKLSRAYQYKGTFYNALGNDSLALHWLGEADKIARKTHDKLRQGIVLELMAYIYVEKSIYKKALDFRLHALEIFTEINNQEKIGEILPNIGVTYFYLADYPMALNYYLKALALAQKNEEQKTEALTLGNIGLVYKKMNKLQTAISYYEKAAKLALSIGYEENYGNTLGNIGVIYDLMDKPEKSIEYYHKALDIARKNGDKRLEANQLTNMGVAYHSLKQYHNAISHLKGALDIYKINPSSHAMTVVYNELASILLKAPDSALISLNIPVNSRYQEAEKYARLSIKTSKEIEATDREMESWSTLADVYSKQKDYKHALEAFRHVYDLRDSILNEDKRTEIARIDMQYEAEKQQALADEEIKNEKKIRNYSLAGAFILLMAAGSIFVFYKKHRDALQTQNELLYKAKVADTDMRILRLQMNPHFIFNSLNSISDYISKNDIHTADYYLSKFAKLMRGILENSEEKEIPLEDELKMLELYMQLESSRLGNKFTYEIKVSKEVNPDTTLIPPLILQPFVENSIWHGLSSKEGNGKITIEISHENSMLNCVVEDNGIGRAAAKSTSAKSTSGKSYGMKITKDRIELLNKLKNTNASVNLIDLEKGTRVEVNLPFETEI